MGDRAGRAETLGPGHGQRAGGAGQDELANRQAVGGLQEVEAVVQAQGSGLRAQGPARADPTQRRTRMGHFGNELVVEGA